MYLKRRTYGLEESDDSSCRLCQGKSEMKMKTFREIRGGKQRLRENDAIGQRANLAGQKATCGDNCGHIRGGTFEVFARLLAVRRCANLVFCAVYAESWSVSAHESASGRVSGWVKSWRSSAGRASDL